MFKLTDRRRITSTVLALGSINHLTYRELSPRGAVSHLSTPSFV